LVSIGEVFGVGLGYRSILHEQLLVHAQAFDFVEIGVEQYLRSAQLFLLDRDGSRLDEIVTHLPCILHSSSLSIGSVDPIDDEVLSKLRQLLDRTGSTILSEQLAFRRVGERDFGAPLALPHSDAAAKWVAQRYHAMRARIGVPFTLALPGYRPLPHVDWDLATFAARIVEYSNCMLRLDLADLALSAYRDGYEPLALLRRLPGERIAQLHLVLDRGGHASFPDVLLELLDRALALTAADMVIIERDSGFSPFEKLVDYATRARAIFRRHRTSKVPRDCTTEDDELSTLLGVLDPEIEMLQSYQQRMIDYCGTTAASSERLPAAERCAMFGDVALEELDALASERANRMRRVAYLKEHYLTQQLAEWMVWERYGR
jgi:uncharacterized protein (UPF0276 family)